jgi:hypothetical protein
MRAAAISAGKPWNGWKARIRAPAAPKTKDQLQQIKNKDQTKQHSSLVYLLQQLTACIFYSVQFASDPNPANKTTSENQHTPRSQG